MSTVIQFPDMGSRPLTEQVSEEIKALMGRYGVSQTALGAWLGLNQTAVSARLRGKTRWNLPEIERIAEGFAVHPAVLMGGYATDPHRGPMGVCLSCAPVGIRTPNLLIQRFYLCGWWQHERPAPVQRLGLLPRTAS